MEKYRNLINCREIERRMEMIMWHIISKLAVDDLELAVVIKTKWLEVSRRIRDAGRICSWFNGKLCQ